MDMVMWTQIFVGVVIIAIAFYDVFAIFKGGTKASISHLLITWSFKFPAFVFVMGFVMGHLFWQIRPTDELRDLQNKIYDYQEKCISLIEGK